MEPKKRLFLLDAYAMIFKAYYGLIRNPRITRSGMNTSAVFGFVNMLQDLLKREQPSHIAVCFDVGGGTFRHEMFHEYKANRDETPEGILVAVPYIHRILEAYHIPTFSKPGFEADDVIGSLAKMACSHGFETYMVTADKDLGQLVNECTKIYIPGKNEIMGVKEVNEKYGIAHPQQIIDLLALMGDSADNIPGCPSVGSVRAQNLIQQFGSVDYLLEHTDELRGSMRLKVKENADIIRMSKSLATIKTDVPLEWNEQQLLRVPADLAALKKVFDELEFRTLTKRIIEQNEANVGLEAPASPYAARVESGRQASLFDEAFANDDTPKDTPDQPIRNIKSENSDFQLIADFDEAAAYVHQLLASKRVAVHVVAAGEEAMTAKILGFAICPEAHKGAYLPVDGFGMMIDSVKPLFESRVTICANDVKRLMVMLHRHGVAFTAPYFDTSVAHYLLQPERGHSIEGMAQQLLNYEVIDPESYLGPKGRTQKKIYELAPESLVNPACERADVVWALPDVLTRKIEENGMTHLLQQIELPLVKVLAKMEIAGARIDVKALNDYAEVLTHRMNELEQQCYDAAGMNFNTASPAQVGEVLFEHLHLDAKAKKTKTGQYSTTEEVLNKLRNKHPLVDLILELRGIRKLLSTYVKALPLLINPATHRIHTTFNQTVTATGRLSSTNPNLQNIPVRDDMGREIRKAFIPADGNVFFSADYSQIELRLVADFSGDEIMLHAFEHGDDIHAITAAKIYHKPLEEVTPDERRKAKTANFGILYGISSFGLSERLNIPRAEAKQLIDDYFRTFPGIHAYIEHNVALAKQQGYVTTKFGRRRMLPDINSRNAVVRQFSERNAVNAPIQGTAADIMKIAMIAIDRRFEQEGIQSKMILQVHDELNFDVIPAELDKVQQIVVEEMEKAYSGKVRLSASYAAAPNWLAAH